MVCVVRAPGRCADVPSLAAWACSCFTRSGSSVVLVLRVGADAGRAWKGWTTETRLLCCACAGELVCALELVCASPCWICDRVVMCSQVAVCCR